MPLSQSELLSLVSELRALCARPLASRPYARIDAVARSIQEGAGRPTIGAQALDVRFKAEDLYARPHLMAEPLLREILVERLHRLEAAVRANSGEESFPAERRNNVRAGRRWTDRLAGLQSET